MSAASYLKELASLLDLHYVEKVKPFESKKDPMVAINYRAGSIIGNRGGFLTVLSLIAVGNNSRLCILIRYPKVAETIALSAPVKQAFHESTLRLGKKAKIENDCVTLNWGYSIKKPNKEEVVRTVDDVIAALNIHVQAFSGKCEECSQTSAGGIMLRNGLPCYLCQSCQLRITADKELEAEEYSKRETGFIGAFTLATGAALLCAFALSWIYYFFDDKGSLPIKAIVIFPCLIGVVAGMIFAKTATRIDIWKQAVPMFLLCFVLSFAATVGYSVLRRPHAGSFQVLWATYMRFAVLWFNFHLHAKGLMYVLGYVLSGVCCVGIVKSHIPNFKQTFIPLTEAASRTQLGA